MPPFAEWLPSVRISLSASLDRHPVLSATLPITPSISLTFSPRTALSLDVQQNLPCAANWPQLAATPADRATRRGADHIVEAHQQYSPRYWTLFLVALFRAVVNVYMIIYCMQIESIDRLYNNN